MKGNLKTEGSGGRKTLILRVSDLGETTWLLLPAPDTTPGPGLGGEGKVLKVCLSLSTLFFGGISMGVGAWMVEGLSLFAGGDFTIVSVLAE